MIEGFFLKEKKNRIFIYKIKLNVFLLYFKGNKEFYLKF